MRGVNGGEVRGVNGGEVRGVREGGVRGVMSLVVNRRSIFCVCVNNYLV